MPHSRENPNDHSRYEKVFPAAIIYSIGLMILGILLEGPMNIMNIPGGLYKIISMQDLLITDYISIAGPGAAFINAGIVTIISICVIRYSGDPYNGHTIVAIGLMSGFSLFGKNFLNIWPIILGTWLYAHYQREPFAKYASTALLATSLSPLVSYMSFGSTHASIPLGIIVGVVVGFVMPSLASYTYKIQNGLNLYNMGFACGLVAMMIVPMLTAIGDKPDSVLFWAEGYNIRFAVALSLFCGVLIFLGLFKCGMPHWAVWAGYRRLLSTTGRSPSDYLRMFGFGPVLVNIGINGIVGMLYVLLIGGDLNGPTIGGIFTIMGFSATGKHLVNIVPVMAGVSLGAVGMNYAPDYPSLQLAGLFGTTLAPMSGHFGPIYGVLAGIIHSALVLQTGGPVAGLNLYNNGFSGGLIAMVLYPTITAIARHRRPQLRDEDYYDLFEDSNPIDTSSLHSHAGEEDLTNTQPHHHHYHHEHHSIYDEYSIMVDDEPDESEELFWIAHEHEQE